MNHRVIIGVAALVLASSSAFAANKTPRQDRLTACDIGCEKSLGECSKKWGAGDNGCFSSANWCQIGCCLTNLDICHPGGIFTGK
jgi:hypothetical protein